MNVRKHLAGFAIFSIILGSAIFINYLLTSPNVTLPSVPRYADEIAETKEKILEPQSVNFKVRLVSLDFINQQSYTALALERQPGQPAPEKLWVTTVFFSPDRLSGKTWRSTAEISTPFVNGDRREYVATSSCDWCVYSNAPGVSYFARVYVSTTYPGYLPDVQFDGDITTANAVVVQAERKTAKNIVR